MRNWRMTPAMKYSIMSLRKQPFRTAFTIGAGALCSMLILFLLSVYNGVEVGSMSYIRHNKADFWVLQEGAMNIMRGSSILLSAHGDALKQIPGVSHVAPVLFVLAQAEANGRSSTIYIVGFNPQDTLGGPPQIVSGRNIEKAGEIVLDKSFALKEGIHAGDEVTIHRETLKVVGISAGTNMFVIQYAFTTLEQARLTLGYPNIVSCYLVRLSNPQDRVSIGKRIREDVPGIEIFEQDKFLDNNLREMRAGFLPILLIVSAISAFVLAVILTAILIMNISESRKDFAVVMILGSPPSFLPSLITGQAMLLSLSGSIISLFLFFPSAAFLENVFPELSTETDLLHILAVLSIAVVIGILSSLISFRKLKRIYPLEAFE